MGYNNLVDALERFEQSLETYHPIVTVQELAKESGYSAHHFSRLFSSHTNMKLKEYLQGRLLSRLLHQAYHQSDSLSSLAIRYGFKDYETFYRACKHRYGVSPSTLRSGGIEPEQLQQRIYPVRNIDSYTVSGETVTLKPFQLCGLSFFIGPETKSFHAIWRQFTTYAHLIDHPSEKGVSYQYTAWVDEEDAGMSVLCGLPVSDGEHQRSIFTTRNITHEVYLRFFHTSEVSDIGLTYQYIYGTYFSESEHTPLVNWEFQRYREDSKDIEIYIPIVTA
jgi:AraC family transcriptional regulator